MTNQEIREPIQKRSIEKKQNIIKYGFKLMCEKGYHNTNTAEIAKAAGVSTGIVYQYFNDKRDIFIKGIEQYSRTLLFPINEIYSLSEDVSNNKISVNDANIRAISIMLKYKVVNYKTLDIIYNRNKLENVDGLDSILHKEEDL